MNNDNTRSKQGDERPARQSSNQPRKPAPQGTPPQRGGSAPGGGAGRSTTGGSNPQRNQPPGQQPQQGAPRRDNRQPASPTSGTPRQSQPQQPARRNGVPTGGSPAQPGNRQRPSGGQPPAGGGQQAPAGARPQGGAPKRPAQPRQGAPAGPQGGPTKPRTGSPAGQPAGTPKQRPTGGAPGGERRPGRPASSPATPRPRGEQRPPRDGAPRPAADRSNRAVPVSPPAPRGKLRVIPLGGVGEVGKNMTLVEYERDLIMIDCGGKFPEEEQRGIDLIVPDVTYVQQRIGNLRAIIITHGHEDHIGGLPYVLPQLKAAAPIPIYGSPMALGFIESKLNEARLDKLVDLRPVGPGDVVQLGQLAAQFIRVFELGRT